MLTLTHAELHAHACAIDTFLSDLMPLVVSRLTKPQPMERRALVRFHEAKRRAAQLQRTPSWADLAAIRAFYSEAQRLTTETGIPHHVDHEYPLRGRLVSGLHVAANLRVITGAENVRKHNHFEP